MQRGTEPGVAAALFRSLPPVDEVLRRPAIAELQERYGRPLAVAALRDQLAELRQQIAAGRLDDAGLHTALEALPAGVEQRLFRSLRPSLRHVINATGVILQTNLGRAPLSAAALTRVCEVALGYCNLELDLDSGSRGKREDHGEDLLLAVLRKMSGGRGPARPLRATVVNNCAAACLLALNTLAEGGEAIVSRGELVEIGGGFRVPDILRKSGVELREVGTTNRTRIADYSAAVSERTRLILRVHRSNFRIEGFTEQPTLAELRALGDRTGLPIMEDQGTGCLVDLDAASAGEEPTFAGSVAAGMDLVVASGDKLLGGPQCGLVVGTPAIVERVRANPLARALRVDKLTYAALQGTLADYLAGSEESVPVVGMVRATAESVRLRCEALLSALADTGAELQVVPTRNVIGGGTTPGATLPGFALSLRVEGVTENDLASRLRLGEDAIVGRTQAGRVLLDLRAVLPHQDAALLRGTRAAIAGVAAEGPA